MGANESNSLKNIREKIEIESINSQVEKINNSDMVWKALNFNNIMISIMNSSHQILYVNEAFIKKIGISDKKRIIGKRPGEIFNCINNDESKGLHCGETKKCMECLAANLFNSAIEKNVDSSDYVRFVSRENDIIKLLDFNENVVPIEINNEVYYITSFVDASDTIKKRALERVFFHDIMNTISGIKGIMQLIENDIPQIIKEDYIIIEDSFLYLIDEIQAQKQMLDADNNELSMNLGYVNSMEILNFISRLFENKELRQNKALVIDEKSVKTVFISDGSLIIRVLVNMVKNALEASEKDKVVTFGCSTGYNPGEYIEFWVNNKNIIPKEIRNNIFKHSFSTKRNGRGLGTYSMKLIGEKYLNGKVSFNSNKKDGTTFKIRLLIDSKKLFSE